MKNLKNMQEFIKEEWSIKDPFGSKKREQEGREYREKFEQDLKKSKAEKLINIPKNQPPIIKDLMDCIETDNCIVRAKENTGGFSISSQVRKAILSNDMKITLFFDEDDAGYDRDYGVKINDGKYIPLIAEQYYKIEGKIDQFLKEDWGE